MNNKENHNKVNACIFLIIAMIILFIKNYVLIGGEDLFTNEWAILMIIIFGIYFLLLKEGGKNDK